MAGGQPPGSHIGSYVVQRELGEGGLGRVYLTRSPGGRQVAVRTMREELLAVPGFRDRFRAEVAAACRVSGAFAASVVAFDADAPVPWLATAYLDAPTLARLVAERGPLPPAAVRRLVAGLAEALASVHAVDVVHRDLKPSNILMTGDGPRLIDVAIAGAVDSNAVDSGTARPIGSPGYLSPEQRLGQEPTAASDMYSLGAVLCFAVTGSSPHGADSADPVHPRSTRPAPDLSGIDDPLIRTIAEHCLSRDPQARPQPADVLAMLRGEPFAASRGRRRLSLILASVGSGVSAAAIALALVLALPGHGGSGSDSTAGFAWSVPGSGADAYVGMWAGTSNVVYGGELNGLTAYAVATGARLWTWKPPAGDALCGMSESTDQGMGAFDYGRPGTGAGAIDCDHLQVVATDTGRLGWPAPLILDSGPGMTGSPDQSGVKALSIGDGVVSAPYYGAADAAGLGADPDLLAASLRTGQTAWTTNEGRNRLPNGCVLSGVAQVFAGRVYTLGDCGGAGQVDLLAIGGPAVSDVHVVGPLGDCALASASTVAGFFASDGDYLVIGCPGENQNGGLYSLSRTGTTIVPLDSAAASSIAAEAGGTQHVPGGVLLSGATLYLTEPGNQAAATNSPPDALTAISLATGHRLWTHPFPGTTAVTPLAATPTGVQVATEDQPSAATHVLTFTPDGTVASTLTLTSPAASAFDSLNLDANGPYAVIVAGRTTIAFPDNAGTTLTVLGELQTP